MQETPHEFGGLSHEDCESMVQEFMDKLQRRGVDTRAAPPAAIDSTPATAD